MTAAEKGLPRPRRAPRQVRKSIAEPAVRPPSHTLRAGVLAVFPWATSQELECWESRVRDEAGKAPEPLLFALLVCGIRFRVFHLEAAPVMAELREWLTSHPRSMNKALADIVVEAMTAGIEGVVRARPWQEGPDGAPIVIKGRPTETHGAWVAGPLVERYLADEGTPARLARELGKEAADVLLGREVAPNQYSTGRRFVEPRAPELMALILERYNALVAAEEGRSPEPESPRLDRLEHTKWRAERLLNTLAVSGAEGVARDALSAIPNGAWPDFTRSVTRKDKPSGKEQRRGRASAQHGNQRPKRAP